MNICELVIVLEKKNPKMYYKHQLGNVQIDEIGKGQGSKVVDSQLDINKRTLVNKTQSGD